MLPGKVKLKVITENKTGPDDPRGNRSFVLNVEMLFQLS